MKQFITILLLIGATTFFTACEKSPEEKAEEKAEDVFDEAEKKAGELMK